ncbi:hypothetical protein O6H91_17G029000 [Diphasiastrum complanatum]|uniref:Uncharacterized protein n=1 Tax=Diphasiastrum complanatum TaxID=34168 RepID=A0ACC2B592_DIPCM|nr:hypothetical protein O6H91_17G029000 [Diphasiastrum complanatum]
MHRLLQELPDDVFGLVSALVHYRDLCNLGATSRRLHSLCNSDKVWRPQCERFLGERTLDLQSWRKGMSSYKALFRFLHTTKPLLGIWVHQNPELGNLVYVTWGFLSLVGCRVIPQELGPCGLEKGLLWAPVFEIISRYDGSQLFFLHGREHDTDYCYPGRFLPPREDCNVLLLEAEPLAHLSSKDSSPDSPNSPFLEPMTETSEDSAGEECSRSCNGSFEAPITKREIITDAIPFHRLQFGDRRRLLESLAPHIRLKVPLPSRRPLFAASNDRGCDTRFSKKIMDVNLQLMAERRALLLWMSKHRDSCGIGNQCEGVDSEYLLKTLCSSSNRHDARSNAESRASVKPSSKGKVPEILTTTSPSEEGRAKSSVLKQYEFASFVKTKLKQIFGKSSNQDLRLSSHTTVESKRLQLQEFLKQGDAVGLRLQATSWKLTLYRAWPIMHDNRFALYKMPVQEAGDGHEFAGIWGGTFGWPPGKPIEDKPGKPLFLLLLSYDQAEEERLLIATKILEGTHYVVHPNGSAIFTAKMDEPSSESFSWDSFMDGSGVDIVQAYHGEGIAQGYGFRYPGSKPGDLFVDRSGMLAFVWRESRAVLTLQRLDLETLLRKGESVAALAPIANFAYLTKSYNNVFAGYSGTADFATVTSKFRRSDTHA